MEKNNYKWIVKTIPFFKLFIIVFFFSCRRRHTSLQGEWSSDVCSSDLAENKVVRFQLYEALLLPLERVKQNPKWHPEGDALFHSLQVFDLARDELPYDEEFLVAALLHDVGKAIDQADHVAAGIEELNVHITERTDSLIM